MAKLAMKLASQFALRRCFTEGDNCDTESKRNETSAGEQLTFSMQSLRVIPPANIYRVIRM